MSPKNRTIFVTNGSGWPARLIGVTPDPFPPPQRKTEKAVWPRETKSGLPSA